MHFKRTLLSVACTIFSLYSTAWCATPALQHIAIVGTQFGDEGKGALTDYFAEQADIILRYNGGNNTDHTVIVSDKTYKFRSLPSGIIRADKLNIIGNGAVINPHDLMNEITVQQKLGLEITPAQLLIAANTPLVLSLHKQLDQFWGQVKTLQGCELSTTGNGIGPAYSEKIQRLAILAADLLGIDHIPEAQEHLKKKIAAIVEQHYPTLEYFMAQKLCIEKRDKSDKICSSFDAQELYTDREALVENIYQELQQIAPHFNPYVAHYLPVWQVLQEKEQSGSLFLYEGGQAVLLDIDHGTYPYVTSSNTVGTALFTGTGYRAKNSVHVLGVTKAYMTRVGNGPFPSRMEASIAALLQEKGQELSTATRSPRDIGWLDLVALKQAVTVGGIDSLALTKVDILDGLPEIKLVTQYKDHTGNIWQHLPIQGWMWSQIEPVYQTITGWQHTANLTQAEQLPKELLHLIQIIEKHVGVPVSIVTTGAERKDKIILDQRFQLQH